MIVLCEFTSEKFGNLSIFHMELTKKMVDFLSILLYDDDISWKIQEMKRKKTIL